MRHIIAIGSLSLLATLASADVRAEDHSASASDGQPRTQNGGARALRGVFTVVLDPGHGGSNLGAPASVAGVYEKRVTLAITRLVRKRLERDGLRVVTTRDTDTYLTLGERVRRANAARGDVFVSLHANASPENRPKRRGFYAYLLSREVVDIEARKAGDTEAGRRDPGEAVVARAQVRQLALQSAALARTLRQRLGQVREGDGGTRQAPFDVLEGLRMPGALLEVGYIDHPEEGVELLQPDVLHGIADAVAEGIEAFARQGMEAGPEPEQAHNAR